MKVEDISGFKETWRQIGSLIQEMSIHANTFA